MIKYRSPTRWTAFFSAVKELDPTLAVVLGRSMLGTKIKKFAPQGSLSSRSDSSRKKRRKIIINIGETYQFSDASLFLLLKREAFLVTCLFCRPISFSYPDITGAKVRFCVFSQQRTENHAGSRPLCSDVRNSFL